MKVYVRNKKGLRFLSTDIWDDIFVDSVEGTDNIVKVNSIYLNEDTCFPANNSEGKNAIEEIKTCITLESLEKEVYEVILNLELKESFYDKDGHLLHAEVIVDDDDAEIEVDFYYEGGNFLKSEEEKKHYSEVDSAH